MMTFDEKTSINIEFVRLYEQKLESAARGGYECMFEAMHEA